MLLQYIQRYGIFKKELTKVFENKVALINSINEF
jgi:hypothetical protein